MAASWQLPDLIVEAIAYRSPDLVQGAGPENALLPRIAACANELCELASQQAPDAALAGLELIEPTLPDGAPAKFLERIGTGMYGIALQGEKNPPPAQLLGGGPLT